MTLQVFGRFYTLCGGTSLLTPNLSPNGLLVRDISIPFEVVLLLFNEYCGIWICRLEMFVIRGPSFFAGRDYVACPVLMGSPRLMFRLPASVVMSRLLVRRFGAPKTIQNKHPVLHALFSVVDPVGSPSMVTFRLSFALSERP